jgi:esterase/lipase superfamily enzyme
MAELSPATIDIAILVAAALLYAFIWFVSRNLSRLAKILARVAPLGLVIPLMLYLSVVPAARQPNLATREASAPPAGYGGAQRNGSPDAAAQRAEQEQRAAAEERARREAEAVVARQAEAQRAQAERQAAEERARREAQSAAAAKQVEQEAAKRQAEAAPAQPPPPPPAAAAPPAQPPSVAEAPPVAASPPGTPRGAPAPTRSARPQAPGAGSAAPATAPPPGVPTQPEGDWDVVPVFYGTDRVRKEEVKRITYTTERASRLELGQALVTVPKTHQVPNIERPFAIRVPYFNITIYEQAEDPKQHFTIRELKALTREEFIALARARIGGSNAFKDQAVVFVHGYNTSFDYALFRTAQMTYDLKFDGAAFLYSWPSGGDVISYNYDRESSEQAEPYLRQFIDLVIKDTGAKSVSLIAHSMGNMPLLRVLQSLGPSLPPGVTLNQIILAAPDVDRNLFENLAANIKLYGRGVTLYCSNNDLAMSVARKVAGGIPRAGDVPAEGPIVLSGIDTIDVSHTSTDYLTLNHSTYAEKSALLADIGLLLQTGERPPDKRTPILQRINAAKGDFWRYP